MWDKIKKWERDDWIHICMQLLLCMICTYVGICVGKGEPTLSVANSNVQELDATQVFNWGVRFGKDGEKPGFDVDEKVLRKYDAYCMDATEEKKIYLTFDCGFENGNTPAILDALKEHQVSATFFVVGHYLESAPDLVKRMVDEGHTVGNHTYHHPDMSVIKDKDDFAEELQQVCDAYKELTGQEMVKFYRPPQGKYTLNNLQMAKELGYQSFFWSLAYVDWNQKDQPDPQASIEKLCRRIHPGAVVLLHNTSDTNGQIMGDLLTKWKEMGYEFGTLAELCTEG